MIYLEWCCMDRRLFECPWTPFN